MKVLTKLLSVLSLVAFISPNASAADSKASDLDRLNKATFDLMSPRHQRSEAKQENSSARKEQIAKRIEAQTMLEMEMARTGEKMFSPQGGQFSIEYLSSCLWSGVIDMFVEGNYAYCAFINGLMILDVSNPAHPDSVGSFAVPTGLNDLFKEGDYVYLATGGAGLIVVSVSDPTHPVQIGACDDWTWTYAVFVKNTIAYVRGGGSLLLIIDVSDPSHPEPISSTYIAGTGTVVIHGTLALLSDWGGCKVSIVDISDPTQPSLMGSYSAPALVDGVAVRDTLMFVACSQIVIVNIADPTSPDSVGNFDTQCWPYDVAARDSLVYVASPCGLEIVNVSDPANPGSLGYTHTSGTSICLFLQGDYAYVGDISEGWSFQGVEVVDVSNPATPWLVGTYQVPDPVVNVFVQDSLVFVASAYPNLRILSFATPSQPKHLSMYDSRWSCGVLDVFVVDTLAYMATSCGIEIVDVGDPVYPEYVGSLGIPGQPVKVFLQDTMAYLTEFPSGVQIINVADPRFPRVVGSWVSPGTYTSDVLIQDTIAYVAASDSGLQIFDVADPTNPQRVGVYDTSGHAYSVFVKDTLAFLMNDIAGLGFLVLDVSDPASPKFVGKGDLIYGDIPSDIYVVDNAAYVACLSSGLLVVDVSNPAFPTLAARFDTPILAEGVFARDSLVWVADRNSLMTFKVSYHPYGGPAWHVSTTGSDITGDGSAEEPFATIQRGIDASNNGDTVFVHQGTYTGDGNRDIDLKGKAILVTSDSVPNGTIIDCESGPSNPHRGFYIHNGEDLSTVIEGLTIKNAYLSSQNGGGLYCINASPMIVNCVFQANSAPAGSGALFGNSSAKLLNCRFQQNLGKFVGGGIHSSGGSLTLDGCIFEGNYAELGGGLFSGYDSSLSLNSCLFTANGSGSIAQEGGAILTKSSDLIIQNCTFSRNTSPHGSAIASDSSTLTIRNSICAFGVSSAPIYCEGANNSLQFHCTDIFGNAGGDWVGCIAGQQGINGNLSLDPEFCDTATANYYIKGTSPCAPANNSCSLQIGAYGIGCGWILNDPGNPDTVIVDCPVVDTLVLKHPGIDSVAIPLYVFNDEPVLALKLGFSYSGDSVEITSWSLDSSVVPAPSRPFKMTQASPAENKFLIGWIDLTGMYSIPAGRGLLGTLYMRVYGGGSSMTIDLDSVFVPPAGEWQFYADTGSAPGNQWGTFSPQYHDCGTNDIFLGALCGDADGDRTVIVSDIVYLVNYIFGGGLPPRPMEVGDCDCTGDVNISDAVCLIEYIFGSGPPPCEGPLCH